MYHNFPGNTDETAASFDQQCRHIATHYSPVPMSEAASAITAGHSLPPNAVMLTVDDGYRDFYVTAWPVLRRHGIPATVYLMTDFIDGRTWPWWDQLQFAFTHTTLGSVQIHGAAPLALGSPEQRQSAYHNTLKYLKTVPNQVRLRFLADLPRCLDVDIPQRPPAGLEALSWAEVREMAASGIEFGAHTKTHPILSSVETESELRDEISGSRGRLAEELGRPPEHFCYPNGRIEDIRGRARAIVEECGFATAVTTERGFNDRTADRLMLRRIGCEPGDPAHYFRQQLAGFRI
jgi:peptidoglycan/xylan/chitin deacetylase (PgdA/CDA1 family)